MTMLVPPFGASISGFGPPTPWNAGRAIRDDDLRAIRMQPDEDRIGLQRQRVGDDVVARTGR